MLTNYGILSNETSSKDNYFEILADKINDFQVIILYDRQPNRFNYNYLINFPSKVLKEKVRNNYIFPRVESETFIVWQQAYEANQELFYRLRLRARSEMLLRITEFMVAKFFSVYETYLTPLLKNNPTLKWDLLNKLYYKYETMLRENTRVLDEKAWKGFSHWFKQYLSTHVLKEMIEIVGYPKLMTMQREELNQRFFQKMNRLFSEDDHFMDEFTDSVNVYIEKWVAEIINASDMEEGSIEHITDLFGTDAQLQTDDSIGSLVKSRNVMVMSNVVYQSVVEVLSNNKFDPENNCEWPTAQVEGTMANGYVQLKGKASAHEPNNSLQDQLWLQVNGVSELDVDIFDALCHIYLSTSPASQEFVDIQFDDLLSIRGLKPKISGNGRRGGYEAKQRRQVLKALSILQELWVNMENVVVYEKGRQIKKTLRGRVFNFKNKAGDDYRFQQDEIPDQFTFSMGEVFNSFLMGSGRQVKLLPKQALEYNPYQRKWEKKLIRYLSWRWRTQARRGSYLQPHKIGTLLEKIDMNNESQTPSRIRERFEKALDVLLDEGIITFWQYDYWDESNMMKRGWLKIWQEATVIIAPPDDILKHYQPLERKKTVERPHSISVANEVGEQSAIGDDFKRKRLQLGLTLQQVSRELEISISYLSNIERGSTTPSYSIYRRLNAWLA